jgi:integrase
MNTVPKLGSMVESATSIESPNLKGDSMARRRYQKGSLVRRGDVWYGRWWEDFFGPEGRCRKYVCERLGTIEDFATKKLAHRELEQRIARVNSPLYRGVSTILFSQFAVSWQERILPQMKPSTAINYRTIIRKHLSPWLGNLQLSQICPELVQDFVVKLPASPKTVRNVVNCLRSMWNTAESWGYVHYDPFRGMRLPQIVITERPYFTLEEVREILAAAPEPYRTFYWLAAETGLRAGELCGLRWCDIGTTELRVRQTVWRGKIQTPKSAAASRPVALSPHLAAMLSLKRETDSNQLVFRTKNGTPWSADLLVKRNLHKLCVKLRIAPRGLHAFRHGQGTLLDQMNVPVKVRQQRLGHTSAELTLNTYTHAITADERKFVDELGEILHANEHKKGNGLEVESSKPFVIN